MSVLVSKIKKETHLETKLSKLYSDAKLAQFYEVSDQNRLDYEAIIELSKEANSILDLGCGTGLLSVALSKNAHVVAVDPAKAMLNIAKQRNGSTAVDWIEGDAREVRLNRKFDFIVLSGHAFQVFLHAEDQLKVLKTIAVHLADGAYFIFDSRNPNFPESKERTKKQTRRNFRHSSLGECEMWNCSSYDEETGILTYENGYRLASQIEEISAQERIKYTSVVELSELLSIAGLEMGQCFGNWEQAPFHEHSKEIIILGRLKG